MCDIKLLYITSTVPSAMNWNLKFCTLNQYSFLC